MPVVIDVNTGIAQDLPQADAQSALHSGSHGVPLVSPEGQHITAGLEEASNYLSQGYKQPDSSDLSKMLSYAQYSAPVEQAKTALEGAASAATLGLSTGLETATGVDSKAIRERERVNPGVHAIGEMAGLAGSALFGGAGSAIGKAGNALKAGYTAGIVAPTLVTRAAATALKAASEFALVETGDQVSRMFAQDPEQTIQTALADIGLSAALGGALGGVGSAAGNVMWEVSQAPKLEAFLSKFKAKALTEAEGEVLGIDPFTKKPLSKAPEAGAVLDKEAAKIDEHITGGLADLVSSFIPGAGPAKFVYNTLGKYVGPKAMGGLKNATLKFLGSEAQINAGAFDVMASLASRLEKGVKLFNKASNGVFGESAEALDYLLPDQKGLDRLKKGVDASTEDPNLLLNSGGSLGHYLPDHAAEAGATLTRAVTYLDSIKPQTTPKGAFDTERTPDPMEEAKWHRALTIAEQPLSVYHYIKQGTLTAGDMTTLQAIYPGMFNGMREAMFDRMVSSIDKGASLPYSTRLSLSMFLGMPLESSIMPANLASNQALMGGLAQQAQAPTGGPSRQIKGYQAQGLKKIAQGAATPSQARQYSNQSYQS